MSLRVHDINERAWRLYEEVGFRRVPERTEEMPVRELEGFPGRRVPPMVRRPTSYLTLAPCLVLTGRPGLRAGELVYGAPNELRLALVIM